MLVVTLNMVRVDRRRREPLQLQLYGQVRRAIISGELASGARLPSARDLVEQLGLSRNTIVYAFERLVAEGYLQSRIGSGMFVAHLPALERPRTGSGSNANVASSDRVHIARRVAPLTEVSVNPEYPTLKVRPFRPCQPAVAEFPLRSWNRARSYALRLQAKELMCEGDVAGLPRLRAALATYLRDARGVKCGAEQIVITAGAQEALSLISASLVETGDAVWMEDPGYLGARASFLRAGAKLTPVSVDAEGLTVSRLRQTPRLIYVTPSRQFPLGTTMSLPRRLALLEFARTNGVWLVEDDYDSEFRYVGRPVPSLQGLDEGGRVIYVGSFSKVLFGSLRLGYYSQSEGSRIWHIARHRAGDRRSFHRGGLLRRARAADAKALPRAAGQLSSGGTEVPLRTTHFPADRRRHGRVGLAGARRRRRGALETFSRGGDRCPAAVSLLSQALPAGPALRVHSLYSGPNSVGATGYQRLRPVG